MRFQRSAFTLVEILIAMIIVGILAAVAIPKFNTMKARANFAAMKVALKNLGQAEEAFFADHGEYSANLDSLNFKPSPEMTLTVVEASATGWSALIQHPQAVPHRCAFFLGTANPLAPATAQGALGCN
jgi:prepilin-type N-terminal cleavage/methylation domain-containing protein